jgi:cytochrome c
MTTKLTRAVGNRTAVLLLGLVLGAGAVMAGCATPEKGAAPPQEALTGDPDRGAELITSYGCSTCHVVPGVDGADGLVGPPLDKIALRTYLAGELTNSAANMQRWIRDPQQVEPGTAMPDLDVTEQDAEDITAYLYTLK